MHYEPCMICITSPIAFFSWVKNKIASARMTEVLDDVEKIVRFWEKFPKPKRLNSKSCKMSKLHWMNFLLLQSYTSSAMLLVLWSHFWSIFILINRWFRSYSLSQKPSLLVFLRSLCSLKSMNSANLLDNWRKLTPLTKQNCYLLTKLTTIDVAVNRLKQSDAITSSQKEFKEGFQLFLITMLSKLFWEESIRICSASMCKYVWTIENVNIAKRKATREIQSSSEVFHWP